MISSTSQQWAPQTVSGLNQTDLPWLLYFGSLNDTVDQAVSRLPAEHCVLHAGYSQEVRSLHLLYKPGVGRVSISNNYGLFSIVDGELHDQDKLNAEFSDEGGNLQTADLFSLSYLKWGENFLEHIQGSFNSILWDQGREHFYCSRDRTRPASNVLFKARLGDRFFPFY